MALSWSRLSQIWSTSPSQKNMSDCQPTLPKSGLYTKFFIFTRCSGLNHFLDSGPTKKSFQQRWQVTQNILCLVHHLLMHNCLVFSVFTTTIKMNLIDQQTLKIEGLLHCVQNLSQSITDCLAVPIKGDNPINIVDPRNFYCFVVSDPTSLRIFDIGELLLLFCQETGKTVTQQRDKLHSCAISLMTKTARSLSIERSLQFLNC